MAIHHTAVFVFVVIIGCNLVLYPSLFSKLFHQWFGGPEVKTKAQSPLEDVPPPMRGRPPSFQGPASVQHRQGPMSDRNPFGSGGKVQEPGFKGVMGTVLPVYAVGIMIYFMFVIYKVFLKEKPTKDPLTGRMVRDQHKHHPTTMDHRLRVEEELLQKRLSEELRKHGYGKQNPADSNTGKAASNSDGEVAVLQNRLEQTERTMAKMLEMMTSMGISMSQMSNHLENTEGKSEEPVKPAEAHDGEAKNSDPKEDIEECVEECTEECIEEECDSEIEADENSASSEEEEFCQDEDEDDDVSEDDMDDEDDVDDDDDTSLGEVEDLGANETIEEDEGTVRRRNVTGLQA